MDTWWKKLIYSSWLKIIAVLGFFLVFFLTLFIVLSSRAITNQGKYGFYDTCNSFMYKAGYVRDSIVRYRSPEIINTITAEDIQKYKEAHGGILSEEEAKQMIIKDRKDYQRIIQNELYNNNINVDFYAKSLKDNIVITNMDTSIGEEKILEDLTNRGIYLVGDGHYINKISMEYGEYGTHGYDVDLYEIYNNNSITHNNYYQGEWFEDEDEYEVYVALKQPLEIGDAFYTYKQDFVNLYNPKWDVTYKAMAFTVLVGILLIIYWLVAVGRSAKREGIRMNGFDRIPFEFQLIGLGITTFIFVELMIRINSSFDLASYLPYVGKRTDPEIAVVAIIVFVVSSAYVGMGLAVVSSLIKHMKNKSLKEYIGIIRLIKLLKECLMTNRMLMVATFVLISINAGVFLFIFFASFASSSVAILFILLIAWSIVLLLGLGKIVLDYKSILEGTKNIARGNLEHKIQFEKSLPVLVDLADTVNTIGTGLEKAVAQSVKSERLKAELITNVSHDLKTPLTSIISYIDLLKGEEIHNEVAKEYIGILDERSNRLKQLVEDLVEASKAVTGNVEAKLAPFRLDELVLQAVGEYTDRLEAQGLQLVITQVQVAEVMGDSRHVWRIVENLLSNVSKYAMPHTRAYMEVLNQGDYGTFIIKNISKEALNIEPEELTERFVRGDASRTTEGSGLGLAIAQSLIDLQAGRMIISIDGDLFKVEVKIPTVKNSVSLEK